MLLDNVKPFRPKRAQAPLASAVFSDEEQRPLRVSVQVDEHHKHVVWISRGNIPGCWYYDTLAGTSDMCRKPREPGAGLWIDFGRNIGIDGQTMDEIMSWLQSTIGPPPFTPYLDHPDLPF